MVADGILVLVHNDVCPLGIHTDDECTCIKNPITKRTHLKSITDALGELESIGDHLAARGPGAGPLSTTVGKLPASPLEAPNSSGASDVLVTATVLLRAAVLSGKDIAKRWRGTTG
ncbi:hypothetical protein [Kitasatospora sp. NBC_01266]|uniref:hypothetical protein n=1 Tax=Kitasatospora sp. NBC_01266 TaxID=2903572 RepID=UPI002E2F4FD6|nr:hypothetical protein [Kitasatospora sp. NBC_01266]